jgi:hypothetical protein
MNHIGAFRGAPSLETVARVAMIGRANTSSGSNAHGISEPNHA